VQRRHASEATVVLEVIIRGRHLGSWRGLPPTGRHVQFPLCGIYTFDDDNRLAGEKIYYDRATVLRQLGVFHEPDSFWGRIGAIAMHPVTMARILGRMIWRG
jgi:SnoaL-like polyketide cyclase